MYNSYDATGLLDPLWLVHVSNVFINYVRLLCIFHELSPSISFMYTNAIFVPSHALAVIDVTLSHLAHLHPCRPNHQRRSHGEGFRVRTTHLSSIIIVTR